MFKADGFPGVKSLRSKNLIEKLRICLRWAAETDTYIVGWNTPFDVAWLIALGLREEVYACKWLDGMLLAKHYEQPPTFEQNTNSAQARGFGLKAVVAHYLPGRAGYEKDIDFGTTDPAQLARLLDYNEMDVDCTLDLTRKFLDLLTARQKRAALIEARSIPMIAEAMVEGLCADRAAAERLAGTLADRKNEAFVTLKLTQDNITPAVLASPVQLRKLLHEDWGLSVAGWTDKGAPSTDREALQALATLDPRAALVNTYRESTNNLTKFALRTVESLDYNGDGRVRPAPRIYGTYTGRLTYSSSQGRGKNEVPTGVALHQWKRDPEFRKLIKPPDGYTLVEFDFAGQEFRWMAVASGDETMIALCRPGEDAHAYMGASIQGQDYRELQARVKEGDKTAKAVRQLGKVANLSLQYRTSAMRLLQVAAVQYGIKLSDTEARNIHATYRRTYPRVPVYWAAQKNSIVRQGYVENLLGRRVHLLPYSARAREMAWAYDSTAINYPIQSIGAEQKFLALMVARTILPHFDGRFYFELHDGIMFVIPDRYAQQFFPVMKQALSNLPYKRAWGLDFPVEFPVDGKMGPSWGELSEPQD